MVYEKKAQVEPELEKLISRECLQGKKPLSKEGIASSAAARWKKTSRRFGLNKIDDLERLVLDRRWS
ncbi:hypothetical protein HPP92_000275 [Vanilla planifolia]|uniref:Uncharacterized protein n=1 Tax=Vanilla planifolia TaxID=51239 RepID=A0A835S0A9_VANPL|nr:hypothetical protein HPP92_000275 [Vanilla planifolia]